MELLNKYYMILIININWDNHYRKNMEININKY
jgi:hypothetical protein